MLTFEIIKDLNIPQMHIWTCKMTLAAMWEKDTGEEKIL